MMRLLLLWMGIGWFSAWVQEAGEIAVPKRHTVVQEETVQAGLYQAAGSNACGVARGEESSLRAQKAGSAGNALVIYDLFPKAQAGEHGIFLQYRDRRSSQYTDLTRSSATLWMTPNTPWNVPYIERTSQPGTIVAHPASVVQCLYDRDAIIRVRVDLPFSEVRITGQTGNDLGSEVIFYIYQGATNWSQPLWKGGLKATFDLTVPCAPGDEFFFATAPGSNDVNDHGFWRNLTLTGAAVDRPLEFVRQPVSQSVALGDTVTFSVDVASDRPITYQWRFNDAPIEGATTKTLTLSSAQRAQQGAYAVWVSDGRVTTNSATATLSVNTPPTLPPLAELLADEGQTLDLVIAAADLDGQTLRYRFAGAPPAGAVIDPNTGRFTWTPTETQGPATYPMLVVASDSGTPSLSATQQFQVVVAEVNTAPRLETIPDQTVNPGDSLRFRASAMDTDLPPNRLTFQLGPGLASDVRIDAATGEIYWAVPANHPPGTNRVTVIVTDDGVPACSDTRSFAIVIHPRIQPPTIVSGPQSLTVVEGDPATFAVAAAGDTPLYYQWRKDSVAIAGATNASYPIRMTRLADAGAYSVTVSNAAGAVDSPPGQLLVKSPDLKPATLEGQITDALNGAPVPDVQLAIGGYAVSSDADGWYRFTQLVGEPLQADFDANVRRGAPPLTVRFSSRCAESTLVLTGDKPGYLSYTNARFDLVAGAITRLDFSLSPANISGLRIVLNWGAKPRDLDAHLLAPTIQGLNHEVSYNARGSINSPPYAVLDIDRTDGFGPETISVTRLQAGVYRYYVQNFQDEQGDTGALSDSGATAQIYTETGLARTIQAPRAGTGDFWDVAAIDGASGAITIRNLITATRPSRANLDTPGENPSENPAGNPPLLTRYRWDFGDGTTSAEEHPLKRYDAPGSYDVCLLVQRDDGRQDIRVKQGFVTVDGTADSQPILNLRRAGAAVIASWTSNQEGWVLEFKTRLSDPQWEPVTIAPDPAADGNHSVTLPLADEGYFRLRIP